MTNQLQSLKESYDKFPYKSYPFPKSTPLHLRTLGTFFGMNPPEIKHARVLEIGCASGGNIIPLAVQYPDAHFLGAGGAGLSRLRLAFSAMANEISPGRRLVLGISTVDPERIRIPFGMPLTSLSVSASTPKVFAA